MNISMWIDDFVHLDGSDGDYVLQFHHMGVDQQTNKQKKCLCRVLYPSTLLHALKLYCDYAKTEKDLNKQSLKNADEIIKAIRMQNLKIEKFCENFYRRADFQGKKAFTLKDEFKADKLIAGDSDVKKK
jgi:hypothetical protein